MFSISRGQVEQVEKFVNQVNVAMRMSQDHQQLSQIVDKIEAYEIVEPPNEECAKVIWKFSCWNKQKTALVLDHDPHVLIWLKERHVIGHACLVFIYPGDLNRSLKVVQVI